MKIVSKSQFNYLVVHDGMPFKFFRYKIKGTDKPAGCYIDHDNKLQTVGFDSPYYKLFQEKIDERKRR